MVKRLTMLLAGLFLMTGVALAQSTVSGTVIDENGDPIVGAAVRVNGTKTGTVTGVSALAGYCTAKNGHRLCFSIINQGIRNSREGRNFQDQVCAILCR